ncbi:MAG TPA: hypothetical protein VK003_01085 [Oceanobacillus sp.]|nr:hypothetical protein [Oceanobacillus sp.]
MAELFAFVIVPSRDEFIEFYTDVLLPALESAGYQVQRAENVFDQQNSLKDAVLNIYRANIIVADLTIPNANVVYELGIAQGLMKPTILITQRMERVPFDLRSYRVLEYSLHYKRVEEFKAKLRDLAEQHKTGLIDYGNPVMDFIPNLVSGTSAEKLLVDEIEVSQNGTAPHDQATPNEANKERPKILEFALEAVQAMDQINGGVKRVSETTADFTQQLNDQTANIKSIRARGVSGDPKELRDVLNATAEEMETYATNTESAIPTLRSSWERLLKSTTDLIAAVSIESSQDREAANLFAGQMQALQGTVNNGVSELARLKEAIVRTPNISKNLNRAIIRTEQAVNAVTLELATGQSYIQRTLNLLQERLSAPVGEAAPILEE